MSKPRVRFSRSSLYLLSLINLSLALLRPAAAQPALPQSSILPPLRMPNLAVGTRCFGYLPCTPIDPFGLRLRAAALAVFRPEKGHDRDFYAARIQIVPAITLMRWAEVGVAIPITLYTKEIGVATVYEPLEIYGRVRIPLEGLLGGGAVTASGGLRLAYGPFAGGLPPLPSETAAPAAPMPDLMAQAIAAYRKKTEVEFALAISKRKGPVSFTGAIGASVAVGRLELSGGGELSFRMFKVVEAFVQGQGIGVLSCPPAEAALNFCAPGFRFGAGIRLDGDLGQFGMMVATAGGAVEPGWAVGVQAGLDYDETTRRRHGDGVEAAQQWWDRRFDAMARGWAAWKSAAAVWEDEGEAARRVRPPRRGPFLDLLGGPSPQPSSPWLDGLLGEDAPLPYPLLPDASPPVSGIKVSGPTAARGKPPGRKPPRRTLFAQANARAALDRQLTREPRLVLPGSLELMTDEELAREQWSVIQEELRRAEQKQWRDSPALPPMEKVILNWVATAPARGVLGLLAMSGPGRRAEAEEQMSKLRPLRCTPAEEEACSAVEGMLDAMATILAPSAAEAVVAERAMLALARQSANQTGHAAEFAAAEQALGLAETTSAEASELGGSRVSQFLASIADRLNPANYRVKGLGSNFGNINFRPPRSPRAAPTAVVTEAGTGLEGEAIHIVPTEPPPQVLGRGSTANPSKNRVLPRDLREQLAVEEAMANPAAGKKIDLEMADPRWPASEGWVKMQQSVRSGGEDRKIVVHYVWNQATGAVDDFKIVLSARAQ